MGVWGVNSMCLKGVYGEAWGFDRKVTRFCEFVSLVSSTIPLTSNSWVSDRMFLYLFKLIDLVIHFLNFVSGSLNVTLFLSLFVCVPVSFFRLGVSW